MKKKMLTVIVLSLFLVGESVNVNAANINVDDKNQVLFEQAYEEYKNDEEYLRMKRDLGEEYATQFLWDVVENSYATNKQRGGSGNECYQFVKNIMQTKNYNCGSTTTLQTLYGLNSASKVNGTTDKEKIATLDAEYNVDSQGSMYVYQVTNALNKYNSGNQTYVYKKGTNMTLAGFEENVANSLTYCKPVILHARTKYLSYYGGKVSGHYISVDYINRTTDKVRLVDCNNNSSYYGIHNSVPLSEAYATISAESDRYLIY